MDEDLRLIIIIVLAASAGCFVGMVIASSRAREAYRFIDDLRRWSSRAREATHEYSQGFENARSDVCHMIDAYDRGE